MTDLTTNHRLDIDNLYRLFEQQAIATPDKIAVLDSEGEASYQTLRAQSEAVHATLSSHDIGPDKVVAIVMERSADLLAVMLGVLRAGCAYVALDPNDPPERLLRMVLHCNAEVLFTDAPLSIVHYLTAESQNLITIAPSNLPPVDANAIPPVVPGTDRLAYLLFTSGTTGEPKAVMVSQLNVIHLLHSSAQYLQMDPSDRYLAVSTVAFDASVIEFLLPLVVGASLLLRDGNLLLSPKKLAREIEANCVTIMQTAPSVWATVLKKSGSFPKLRVAITHGEAAPLDLAERLIDQAEIAFNMYGPTETTVWATGHQLVADHLQSCGATSAPIGQQLDHVQTYVVDDLGQIIENGAEGELWLGGPSVTMGYWKDEEQTNAKFTHLKSDRIYKTGDRVRQNSDGTLYFLGRIDDQLQLHGVRVEPQEIATAALEHPDVETAIATWFDDPERGRQMLVATVPRSGGALSQDDIHSFLVKRIPRRMMPSSILVIPEMPLTQNGKIDRSILRNLVAEQRIHAPLSNRQLSSNDFQSQTEKDLAECWERVLGTTVMSRNEQFFLIGGDSLSAVYMISELETMYEIELQLNCVFENPTIRTLARYIDAVRIAANASTSQRFVFPIGQQSESIAPMFFCNVNLCVAKKGVWTSEIPLCAVLHWSKGEGLARAASIEGMAAMLLSRIREVQSAGPYRLAGYSFGGLLAYEIAQQLQLAGEEVEYLFLLDPTPPGKLEVLPIRIRVKARAKRIMQGPAEIGLVKWARTMNPFSKRFKRRVRYSVMLNSILSIMYNIVDWRIRNPNKLKWLPAHLYFWRAYAHFARPLIPLYKAKPYTGRALIVECTVGHGGGSAYKALLQGKVEQLNIDSSHNLLFDSPALNVWMPWLARKIN
jgi:enterobactin synthetase component F